MKSFKWVGFILLLMIGMMGMSMNGCKDGVEGFSYSLEPVDYHHIDAMVLAEYQVWHGSASHSAAFSGEPMLPNNRPYDSRDTEVIVRHILDAKERGIDGFVVNWYGPKAGVPNDVDRDFQDKATAKLFKWAKKLKFKVALLYDEGTIRWSETDPNLYEARVKSDLSYAERYLNSPAYLNINGLPALMIFSYDDIDPHLDWKEIRNHLTVPVTLIERDPNPLTPEYDADFDGHYAWVYATNGAWDPDGLEWGEEYMQWFYNVVNGIYAHKVAIGGVWPGFDDTFAPWGQNRFMVRQGTTLHDRLLSMAVSGNVDYIMIGTWNDFEEGTDIEYGVQMLVDMERADPEVLLRSSPVLVGWRADATGAHLQVYKNYQLLYDQAHDPGIYISLSTGNFYELKVWLPGEAEPLTKWIKIRRNDPVPGVEPVSVD